MGTWGFDALGAEGGSLAWLAAYQRVLVNAFVDIECTGFPFSEFEHRKFVKKADRVRASIVEGLRGSSELQEYCDLNGLSVEGFNLNSAPQLCAFLFSDESEGGLGVMPTRYSKKTGTPSTDKESLTRFAEEGVEFAGDLLALRNFSKMLSAFGQPLLDLYNPQTGAIHPSYFIAKVVDEAGTSSGTKTGRLSCRSPNLQQLPKRDKSKDRGVSGIDVRRSFIPMRRDHVLIELDQSQVEVRVAGMYAKDVQMGKFFRLGGDFHTRVAAMVNKIDYDVMWGVLKSEGEHPDYDEYKGLRSAAKQVTFGLLYGMGQDKLIRACNMTEAQGAEFIATYFSIFPHLAIWRDAAIVKAKRTGKVTTLFGRTRQIAMQGFKSEDGRESRIGINTPIQSCLPARTRVLTLDRGWVSIGELSDKGAYTVWTGERWALARRLRMGEAPCCRLFLSDGRTFDCDDRHKLLVHGPVYPVWAEVASLVGKELVRDVDVGEPWGVQLGSSDDWYWAGRFLGDGSFTGGNHWRIAFHVDETEDIAEFTAWLATKNLRGKTNSTKGFYVGTPTGKIRAISVGGSTQVGISLWESLGLSPAWRSRTKRIPNVVFTLDRSRREALFQGYFDADGSGDLGRFKRVRSRKASNKLTSGNLALLQDALQLAQTLSLTGQIAQVAHHKNVWYDLRLHQAPASLVVERVLPLPPEETYTLTVDDERHAYSSEGLISKNCAADITLYGLARIWEELLRRGCEAQILGTIHDSIIFSLPYREVNTVLPWVVEYMERPPGLEWLLDSVPVPLAVDLDVGKNFRDMKELSIDEVRQGAVDTDRLKNL